MDKNTLLGLLLMGAVIFGFVYLNQPSAEEIERQRQERLAAEAEQTSAEAIQALAFDTISDADADMLRTGLSMYGKADTASVPATYSYTAPDIALTMRGDSVSGMIDTPYGPISAGKVISNDTAGLDRAAVSAASQAIKRVINDFGRYKNFARHLNGENSTTRLENDVLALEIACRTQRLRLLPQPRHNIRAPMG